MSKKLTNEIIDNKLKFNNRLIIRVGNYINNCTNLTWKCLVCNYEWEALPRKILTRNGTGCVYCAKNQHLTNDIVDDRLIGRNIKRIGQYINAHTKINWQCLICDYRWDACPKAVVGEYHTGCPACKNSKLGITFLTNTEIDVQIKTRNIKRIGNYLGNTFKIEWSCITCNSTWFATPRNVVCGAKTGCPGCSSHFSKLELLWLELNNVPNDIVHRQVKGLISNKQYTVDGYIPETNTIYEFWGDYWHGNPTKHNPLDVNKVANITFGELYQKTMKKRQTILDAGFNLIEIWESDFKNCSTN